MQKDSIMDDPGYECTTPGQLQLAATARAPSCHGCRERGRAAHGWRRLNMTRNQIRQAIADLLAQLERDRKMASLYRRASCRRPGPPWSRLFCYRRGKVNSCRCSTAGWRVNVERDLL